MAGDRGAAAPTRPVGRPGDAAEAAFKDLRWMHRGIPKPPDMRAAAIVLAALVVGVAIVATIADRYRPPQADVVSGTIPIEEARRLPIPPDLGPAPDLDSVIDWSLAAQPIAYEDHVTVLWFRRQVSCTRCGRADGYMQSMHERYAKAGLQVVDVLDISERQFVDGSFLWIALPDFDGAAARTFVDDATVPAHFVAVVDGAGRVRYADDTYPTYELLEPVIAALLVEE